MASASHPYLHRKQITRVSHILQNVSKLPEAVKYDKRKAITVSILKKVCILFSLGIVEYGIYSTNTYNVYHESGTLRFDNARCLRWPAKVQNTVVFEFPVTAVPCFES